MRGALYGFVMWIDGLRDCLFLALSWFGCGYYELLLRVGVVLVITLFIAVWVFVGYVLLSLLTCWGLIIILGFLLLGLGL